MRRPMVRSAMAVVLASAVSAAARPAAVAADRPDVLFADFEAAAYDPWAADGPAFGTGPAVGTLPRQMPVTGFQGKRLASSFHGGDGTTGTLRSPEFKVERKSIRFLIGGGGFEGKTCVNLLVDGKVVRSATGPNIEPGGSEALEASGWDVSEFEGKTARIEAVDRATGGWGHISLDHVTFTDARPPAATGPRSRQLVVEKRFLHLPVKNGAKVRTVKVGVDGRTVREFTIEAADDVPDWWASVDVSAWTGKPLTVDVSAVPVTSKFLDLVEQGDAANKVDPAGVYREPLRPLVHFSPRRGWVNDPNGLVFFNGEYHLFFQHNPYGTKWGNMHWSHAVSRDLVWWEELGVALYPDAMGPMFSGSAVVDWNNTSGFGKDGKPPLVLIYTAAGNPATQCLAWSLDGRAFTKYERNPVVKQFTPGNRDPKVFWHEPTKRWVMVLYVGVDEPAAEKGKKPETKHTIRFLTSPNLRDWEVTGQVDGLYECPDLFPLAVDGDPAKVQWVLTAASSEYFLGSFDGRTFTRRTPKLKGHQGRGFYAAQTFSDLPTADGRRVMIGWLQAPSPGMPFNQAMSVPLELKLLATPAGPRLAFGPAKEIESLRGASFRAQPIDLKPGGDDPLAKAAGGEAMDVRVEFEPTPDAQVELVVRGVRVRFDADKQELAVNDHRAPAPLRQGRQRLVVIADRTSVEVFAGEGLCYVPMPVIPKADDRSVTLKVTRVPVKLLSAEAHVLRSAWER